MAGGLIQIYSSNIKDAPLTYNPEVTFFKVVYKKYTNFAILQTVKNLGNTTFDTYNNYKIDRTGDLLLGMSLEVFIPNFTIENTTTTNLTIDASINSFDIIYNNYKSYIFRVEQVLYIIPIYIFNNLITSINLDPVDFVLIQNNIFLINQYNLNYILIDIQKNNTNSIISELLKFTTFFESYILNTLSIIDYEYYNQLITQKTYIKNIESVIVNNLYLYYNYYNNFSSLKNYYSNYEIQQYFNYVNIENSINVLNYDVDIEYIYCINNNIPDYLSYQYNCLNYNSLFIKTILRNLYPENYNFSFTFWQKIEYNSNTNIISFNILTNNNNTFGEWLNIITNIISQLKLSGSFSLYDKYKLDYEFTENNIKNIFNSLLIKKPIDLFCILSVFINQYDSTNTYINFSDYNNLVLLITEQINVFNILENSNANIKKYSLLKGQTVFPVDLMILNAYNAYKLTDYISKLNIFNDYTFLIYWRNKINIYYYLNYINYDKVNISNKNLQDDNLQYKTLTFYANLNLKNPLRLANIKKYYLDLFYSTSFLGCINSNAFVTTISDNLNTVSTYYIDRINTLSGGVTLSNTINPYYNLVIKNFYDISNFSILNNIITINNIYYNYNSNTKYSINISNIEYIANNFNINYTLTDIILKLYFDIQLPNNIINFTLNEINTISIPLISFPNLTQNANNNFYKINIFNLSNNVILNDNIIAYNIFNLNNLLFKCNSNINNNYFKIVCVNNTARYLFNLTVLDNCYQLSTNTNIILNKNNLSTIDLEFIYVEYNDIGIYNSISGYFYTTPSGLIYNNKNTYWLVNNNNYTILHYGLNNFTNTISDNISYTIREVTKSALPLFDYYLDTNYSDLMNFVFQTPMLFLTDNNSIPYLYFYNIPFLIDSRSELYLNNNLITIILPLNSNQFFESTDVNWNQNNQLNYTNQFDLILYMNNQFDLIYNDETYGNICNSLDLAQELLLNLNYKYITDLSNYGITSQQIILNMNKINKLNLTKYNNDDFSYYNK